MAEVLVNEFTVNRPIDEAWPLICDLERIAPCMPGAQLEEVEGDVYRGNVAIKLGSVATKFKGEATFTERDDDNHTAKLVAQGRDSKGRGNAKADISAHAESLSPTSTRVSVHTDFLMAGKIAQIGRSGILADVSKKLVNEFAANLNEMIDATPSAPDPGAEPTANTDTSQQSAAHRVRKINGPAAEPIEVTNLAGAAVAKRVLPIGLGVAFAIWLFRKLF